VSGAGSEPIRIVIPGPPTGKGRARSRGFIVGGKKAGEQARVAISHYTPDKTRAAQTAARDVIAAAMAGRAPLDGAVALKIHALYPIPRSWPKKRQAMARAMLIFPTVKPDLDNVEKLIKDAANGIIYKDDKQVTDVVKRKRYSDVPCVILYVYPGLVSGDPGATASK
jgi:Holliday junction resolvase RusA-like endonuclease